MYKLYYGGMRQPFVILVETNTFILLEPSDPANTDYQAFLKYQAEGGKVYGADEEVPDGQATE